MNRKYQAPKFLNEHHDQAFCERWLQRKAQAHVRRDRRRGNPNASVSEYKIAINKAVHLSEGRDLYTGELLDWSLLSQYDNEQSKTHGRTYKRKFAMLPSVDHVGDGTGPADFKICSWRTNDSKNDLSQQEFIELCKKVIEHAENAA